MTVLCHMTPKYYHHEDWRSLIQERMCDFTVNGVKGYGFTEFLYRLVTAYICGCPQTSACREFF